MSFSHLSRSFGVTAVLGASTVLATGFEKGTLAGTFEPTHATCSCKNAGDCTCAKGQCKCKSCGRSAKRVIEAIQGTTETTRLPNTARRDDARGGVSI